MNQAQRPMTLQEAIEDAKKLAREGTIKEKEDFVKWACNSIAYLSLQKERNGLITVQAQYIAYLEELKRIEENEI